MLWNILVTFALGQALFAAAGEPKAFLEMRGGHIDGFVFARAERVATVAAFLERVGR